MSLFALAQAGDPDALSELVRRHIPLVQSLCRRFPKSEDVFQQGCVGLVKAIRNYREDSGCRFSTYAVPVVLGEMRRVYSHTLGWRARAALNRAKMYQEKQLRLTGQAPSVLEIATQAGVSPEELALLIEQDKGPLYDETGTFFSSLPDPMGENWLLRFCILDVLSRMPKEESWLIRQRYVAGRTQTELADALSVSQSRISRQEKCAREHFVRAWNEE
ncbi:MAG: sigma-70 family RNA polymerase sigma factor [Clostridia bacterium]|nr:sigma-70 family RNA polymerase sigma factor [Clostridia bacterium]